MADIFVVRGSGDNPGEEIIEPLATGVAVLVQRGRNAIDASTKIKPVNLSAKHRTNMKTGLLVEVVDALQGESYRAKVVSVTNGIAGVESSTQLGLERLA